MRLVFLEYHLKKEEETRKEEEEGSEEEEGRGASSVRSRSRLQEALGRCRDSALLLPMH